MRIWTTYRAGVDSFLVLSLFYILLSAPSQGEEMVVTGRVYSVPYNGQAYTPSRVDLTVRHMGTYSALDGILVFRRASPLSPGNVVTITAKLNSEYIVDKGPTSIRSPLPIL